MSYAWPWHWNPAPHGWYTANGITKFGPLPQRERSDETWPPQRMERNQQSSAIGRASTPQAMRAAADDEERELAALALLSGVADDAQVALLERAATRPDSMDAARQHFAPILASVSKVKP